MTHHGGWVMVVVDETGPVSAVGPYDTRKDATTAWRRVQHGYRASASAAILQLASEDDVAPTNQTGAP